MSSVILSLYSHLVRLLPIYSGLTKISFNPVVNALIKTKQAIATTREGDRILVDLNDYHGRVLYICGTNDRKVSHTVNCHLTDDFIFLDIGANYSTIGLSAARIARRVHLFEPQEYLCDRVEQAIANSGLSNVTIHRFGLFNEDTKLELSMPQHHSGMASVINRGKDWKSVMIELRDTATYVGPLVGKEPFGVKIDIEGAEPQVLPALMAMPNMRFAVCEAAHNTQELYHMAQDFGFDMHGLCKSIFRPKTKKINTYPDMSLYHDILFVR